MMSKEMSPEGSSIVVSRLALIQSAVVITPSQLGTPHVTTHYLSSLDRRVIFGWDNTWQGGLVYLLIFGTGNSGVLFARDLMTACSRTDSGYL